MDTNFSHEQSLSLINEMIHRAQNNVRKERRYSMIFWGYMITVIALSNFVLLHVLSNPNLSFAVWLFVFPAWLVSYFMDRRVDRTALVKTHIDKIGDRIWKGFGIGVIVCIATIYVVAFRLKDPGIMLLINSMIMTMIGIGEFASAVVYRYKPWYWVAAFFWTGAVVCGFLPVDWQFIILAVCMILGFVIPGHILIHQDKKSHV